MQRALPGSSVGKFGGFISSPESKIIQDNVHLADV